MTTNKHVFMVTEEGKPHWLQVQVSDADGYLSITGTLYDNYRMRERHIVSGGTAVVAKHAPEYIRNLLPFASSTNGIPVHYLANTKYFASDRDSWGRRAGEPIMYRYYINCPDNTLVAFKSTRLLRFFETAQYPISTKESVTGFGSHYFKFVDSAGTEAGEVTESICVYTLLAQRTVEGLNALYSAQGHQGIFGNTYKEPYVFAKGKERELDKARKAANWPEATDEDLTAPGLEERLKARIPVLQQRYSDAIAHYNLQVDEAED